MRFTPVEAPWTYFELRRLPLSRTSQTMTAVSAEEGLLSSERSWNLKAALSFICSNAAGAKTALGATKVESKRFRCACSQYPTDAPGPASYRRAGCLIALNRYPAGSPRRVLPRLRPDILLDCVAELSSA